MICEALDVVGMDTCSKDREEVQLTSTDRPQEGVGAFPEGNDRDRFRPRPHGERRVNHVPE